jgi:DNA-directed RNA polymerase specialized sigma24 family protein
MTKTTTGRRDRVTEPAELAAGLVRCFKRMEDHAASDPANLVYLDELTEALRETKLRAIARASRAAREGGDYSIGEIGRILGVSKQAVHQLAGKGKALMEAQRARLGVVSMRERRRARMAEAGVAERRASA